MILVVKLYSYHRIDRILFIKLKGKVIINLLYSDFALFFHIIRDFFRCRSPPTNQFENKQIDWREINGQASKKKEK